MKLKFEYFYSSFTKNELKAIFLDNNIKYNSKYLKQELINILIENNCKPSNINIINYLNRLTKENLLNFANENNIVCRKHYIKDKIKQIILEKLIDTLINYKSILFVENSIVHFLPEEILEKILHYCVKEPFYLSKFTTISKQFYRILSGSIKQKLLDDKYGDVFLYIKYKTFFDKIFIPYTFVRVYDKYNYNIIMYKKQQEITKYKDFLLNIKEIKCNEDSYEFFHINSPPDVINKLSKNYLYIVRL